MLDPLVRAGFQTIAIDAPGFGDSPPLELGRRPTITALSEAVADFLDERNIDRAHLVGNSMGGAIAIELARAGRARTVTAISPAGLWTAREREFCKASLRMTFESIRRFPTALERLTPSALGRTLLASQLIARPWRVPADELSADLRALARSPAFLETLDAFDDYRMSGFQELRSTPITIAWGTRDHLLIPRQARRARRVLTHARHLPLDGCGHIPMWDAPELVAANIIRGTKMS